MGASEFAGELGVGVDLEGNRVSRGPAASEDIHRRRDGDRQDAENAQRNDRGAPQQFHRNRNNQGHHAGQRRQPDEEPLRIAGPPMLIGVGDDVLDPAIWRLSAQSGHGIRLTISENGRSCRGICHGFGT